MYQDHVPCEHKINCPLVYCHCPSTFLLWQLTVSIDLIKLTMLKVEIGSFCCDIGDNSNFLLQKYLLCSPLTLQEMCCLFWLSRERLYRKSALPSTRAG